MPRSRARLQTPTARERAARALRIPTPPVEWPTLPARIGLVLFSLLGRMVAIRCPQGLVPLVQEAGGT